MIKLTPSLLAADLMNLGGEIEAMMKCGVDQLHFDVMDAHFVPNLSFGPSFCRAIHRRFPELKIDAHLMMDNALDYLDAFVGYGASSVTVHEEAFADPGAALRAIHEKGVQAGLSVKPGTPAEALLPYLDQADIILIMSVEPGFGGQKFMPDQVEKIRFLRRAGYRGVIAVDGGVCPDNAALLQQAGANWLVMGTAFFRSPDPQAVARAVEELNEKEGNRQ